MSEPARRGLPTWVVVAAAARLARRTGRRHRAHRAGRPLRSPDAPPVERLAIERVVLRPGVIDLTVLNDGPDPVTIAQVTVDDAFWAFTASRGTTVGHLGRTSIAIPYPWVTGRGPRHQAADVDRHAVHARDRGRRRNAGRARLEPVAVRADRPLRRRHSRSRSGCSGIRSSRGSAPPVSTRCSR